MTSSRWPKPVPPAPDGSGLFTLGEVVLATSGTLERGVPGAPIFGVTHDSRKVQPGDLFIALPGARHDARDFATEASVRGAAAILCAPGGPALPVTLGVIRSADPTRALWDLAVRHRSRIAPRVVAVTGSSGKTTTKELVGAVLGAGGPTVVAVSSFNNHIGVPLTILAADRRTRNLVLELGTSSTGEIGRLTSLARPDWGLITAVGRAHLQGLGGREGVFREKGALAEGLHPLGRLYVPGFEPWSPAMAARAPCVTVFVAEAPVRAGFSTWGTSVAWQGMPVHVPVPGLAGRRAAAMALAVARDAGVDPDLVAGALASFRPQPGRLCACSAGGVLVIDDSYNANPASMAASLDTLASYRAGEPGLRRFAVLGPMAELGGSSARQHRLVGRLAARAKLDALLTVGAETLPLAAEASRRGARVICTATPEEAADRVGRELRPGDAVLFKASRSVKLDRAVALLLAQLEGRTRVESRSEVG